MDFEDKLLSDIGEEKRTIFPAIVYGIEEKYVYLDILFVEKRMIECQSFNVDLFETMQIENGTKIWIDLFTQPGRIIIKVKEVTSFDDPCWQIFETLKAENKIRRPAGPLLYKKRHILDLFTMFK